MVVWVRSGEMVFDAKMEVKMVVDIKLEEKMVASSMLELDQMVVSNLLKEEVKWSKGSMWRITILNR